jgi:uncharacterized membrane protein HdeD (DUF308 family)
MENERLKILKMVEAGQIDAGEAAMLLVTLDEAVSEEPSEAKEVIEPPSRAAAPVESAEDRWARFWIYPLMAGGAVLIAGVLVMALVYAADGAGVWLCCGWLPMLLGVVTLVLALWSRRATWMHLRISEEGKRKMAFSFPLPLSLAALAVRIAQPFVPQLKDTGVDDLILALRESSSRGEPLFIDVEDDQDGERVELYIG